MSTDWRDQTSCCFVFKYIKKRKHLWASSQSGKKFLKRLFQTGLVLSEEITGCWNLPTCTSLTWVRQTVQDFFGVVSKWPPTVQHAQLQQAPCWKLVKKDLYVRMGGLAGVSGSRDGTGAMLENSQLHHNFKNTHEEKKDWRMGQLMLMWSISAYTTTLIKVIDTE